jgi:hypothetical protein
MSKWLPLTPGRHGLSAASTFALSPYGDGEGAFPPP